MLERAGYYGFRAFVVLYAIEAVGLPRDEAFSLYALMTIIGYFAMPVAGIISDLLKANKWILLIGGSLEIISMPFFLSTDKDVLLIGGVLFAIGSGTYTVTSLSSFGRLYFGNHAKLFSGWSFYYVLVNAGAFGGVLGTSIIQENSFNAQYVVFGSMLLFAAGTALAFFNVPKNISTKKSKDKSLVPGTILIVLGTLIIAFFWFCLENLRGTIAFWSYQISQTNSGYDPMFILDLNSYTLGIVGIIMFILTSFLKHSTLRLLSAGFLIAAISVIILQIDYENNTELYYIVIGHTILFTIAEMLIMPAVLKIQTMFSNPRFLGIILGASMLALSLLNKYVLSYFSDVFNKMELKWIVFILFGVLTTIALLFFILHFVVKQRFIYERIEHSQDEELDLKKGEILD